MFFTLGKKDSFKNGSLKGSLGNLKHLGENSIKTNKQTNNTNRLQPYDLADDIIMILYILQSEQYW